MLRYLVARLLAIIPVLFMISLLVFGLQALAPGDPAAKLLEASGVETVTPEMIAQKRAQLHLDEPLIQRYAHWLGDVARGDFGNSYRSYTSVSRMYLDRIGNTALLALVAATLAACIAIPLGAIAAYRQGSFLDMVAQILVAIADALPGFWIALILMLVFALRLGWLPVFGTPTPRGIILPAVVLALSNVALLTRMTRSSILDILGQDYIRVARAKGLTSHRILGLHVLPNAAVPTLTIVGLDLAELLSGTAIVESIFAWPGVGKMAVDAALLGDIPVLAFFALAAGVIYVTMNLVVDLTVAAIDPRLRSR